MVVGKVLYRILITFFPVILEKMTPEIKRALKSMIEELEEKCRKTPNPVDDMFIDLLKALLDIE